MSQLSNFFKGATSEGGVFYPKHYLVAVFSSRSEADNAKLELRNSGRLDEDIISASGAEVVDFSEAQSREGNLVGLVLSAISRTIGTEASYTDRDLAAAKNGAGFIAVLCPNEQVKAKAWSVLTETHPLAARYYAFGGIEHLAGEL